MNDLLFALIASFAINAAFFATAASLKTDKVTDLSYGLSFAFIAAAMIVRSGVWDPGRLFVGVIVLLWALRLASYLFARILKTGTDHRFDGIRESIPRFARFWFLQALTVWVVSLPVIVYLGGSSARAVGPVSVLGCVVALAGLVFEQIADGQKYRFRNDPANAGLFIASGLWKWSRHPNYFGESLFWWGIFVAVIPALSGAGFLVAIGPLFITLMLLFVSGIPPLEKSAEAKYGGDPAYRSYRDRTSLFVPLPPRRE